ncbi:MAG: SufD family Fe-S cluster assembly protein [Patescibacteria group bacterium]
MQTQDIRIRKGERRTEPILLTITKDTTIETILEDGTEATCIVLEVASPDAKVAVTHRCRIGAHARLHIINVTLGGAHVSHELVSKIMGEGSESSIDWIFYAKDAERQRLSARNIFDAREGSGEITVHGVAEGKSHAAFEGKIEITEKGGGTNTYLTEKTLMLDPTAKVDAIPALEIRTNDVKASHSATVTRVSPEDLFYASSRGIPEVAARFMIIEGFLATLLEKLPKKNQERIFASIQEKHGNY